MLNDEGVSSTLFRIQPATGATLLSNLVLRSIDETSKRSHPTLTPDGILQTSRLGKRFKKRWAVNGLSLEVRRGDIFGFLGPNGAGKSTTIRMLFSLIRPTTGDVQLFGHSVSTDRKEALKRVGGIVEKPDFYLYLSAVKNLEIVGSLYGGVPRSRVFEVLDLVGLRDRAFDSVKTYSHGMKQRLGIAQALLNDPELVILDEPTSGLDPQGMKDVRQLVLRLAHEQGKTVFLSSHLLSEIEMVANRMAIINQGKLVVQGGVRELLDKGEHFIVVKGRPKTKIRSILRSRSAPVSSYKEEGGEFRASMKFDDVPLLNRMLVRNGVKVEALVPRRSLEDFFLSLTESEPPR
ncbi:MAG: ABC transporter ATP-binding protein [Ignavibacteriales bacterium]|nr:ABC transporter ATP-binding protein [Ignavibacteriales bacterium]